VMRLVTHKIARSLLHGCRNGNVSAAPRFREASRARAPDSPSPGEHMGEVHAPNAGTRKCRQARS
jgi:hypothetical protein